MSGVKLSVRNDVDARNEAIRIAMGFKAELSRLTADNERLRAALKRLSAAIIAGEEHGDAYDDSDCPVCNALVAASAALSPRAMIAASEDLPAPPESEPK